MEPDVQVESRKAIWGKELPIKMSAKVKLSFGQSEKKEMSLLNVV